MTSAHAGVPSLVVPSPLRATLVSLLVIAVSGCARSSSMGNTSAPAALPALPVSRASAPAPPLSAPLLRAPPPPAASVLPLARPAPPVCGARPSERGAPPPPQGFAFSTAPSSLALRPGAARTLPVVVSVGEAARGGFRGEVTLRGDPLPPGLHLDARPIRAGATRGALTLRLDPGAAPGAGAPLVLRAEAAGADGRRLEAQLSLPFHVRGAPGALDESFGDRGLLELPAARLPRSTMVLAAALDGCQHLLLAGWAGSATERELWLARLTPEGALDPSFGEGGMVSTTLTLAGVRHSLSAASVLALPDGSLVVGGVSRPWLGVAQPVALHYLADGSLDLAFGQAGGLARIEGQPTLDGVTRVVLQRDDRLLFLSKGLFAFDRRGRPDPSFDARPALADRLVATDLALLPDGRILVVGRDPRTSTLFRVARLGADGALDPSFGEAGLLTIAPLPQQLTIHPQRIALLPGGEALILGHAAQRAGGLEHLVVRLDAGGRLDPSFGEGGLRPVRLGQGNFNSPAGLAPRFDGSLVAFGSGIRGARQAAGLFALDARGAPDADFQGGQLFLPFSQPVYAVELLPLDGARALGLARSGIDDSPVLVGLFRVWL